MDFLQKCDFFESATVNRSQSNQRLRRKDKPANTPAPPPNAADADIQHTNRRRLFSSLLQNLRTVKDYFMNLGRDRRDVLMQQVPENSISNLIKMILLPIILVIIAVTMVPMVERIAYQTFNAIFYNDKIPDDRNAMLKRVSVGITLIFDHVIKKLFPVVRLRWSNRKLFKRRVQVLPPVPQPVIP